MMIQNDEELQVTLARIERFQRWLLEMRKRVEPKEFILMASGYRLEIERMQAEVLDYLLSPALTAGVAQLTPEGQAAITGVAVG